MPIVEEDTDTARCQRKAADPAPPADPLKVQGAQPLHSGHEEEKAELLHKVNRLREIVLHNNLAEERCGKYMKYKLTSGSKDHFPAVEALSTVHCFLLSNIMNSE